MTSIKVLVLRLDPDGAPTPISIRRPPSVGSPDPSHHREESTLAERVFQFLDQRTA